MQWELCLRFLRLSTAHIVRYEKSHWTSFGTVCVCMYVCVKSRGEWQQLCQDFPRAESAGSTRHSGQHLQTFSPYHVSSLCVCVCIIHTCIYVKARSAPPNVLPLSKGPPLSSSFCVRLTACVWSSRPSISP